MNHQIISTHIANIRAGDAIEHNGKIMTVCKKDITCNAFFGVMLFGDSYRMGRMPVKKVQIIRAIPTKQ